MNQKIFLGIALLLMLTLIKQDSLLGTESRSSKRNGYLGISVTRLSSRDKKELEVKEGVLVTWVEEDGPSDKAGITEDDVIVEIEGKKINRSQTLSRIIRETKPGTQINVVFIRDGKRETVKVKVGKRKQPVFNFFSEPYFHFKPKPFLGVTLQDLNDDLADYFGVKADEGVLILEVEEDSPAEEAGLKAGDVILKFEDEQISDSKDLNEFLADYEDGDEVTAEVKRHGQNKTFKITLEANRSLGYDFYFHSLPKLKQLERELPKRLERHYDRALDSYKKAKIKLRREANEI